MAMKKDAAPVPPAAALTALGITIKRRESGGRELITDCPYCGKSNHFAVNAVTGVFQCRRCKERGNLISLTRHIRGESSLSAREVIKILQGETGISPTYIPPVYQDEDAELAPIDIRDKFYRAFIKELSLSEEDKKRLLDRGLTSQEVNRLGYRSTPKDRGECVSVTARAIRRCGITPKGVPGFFKNKQGTWTCVLTPSGIFIPALDGKARVQGMQLRVTNPKAKSNGKPVNKYRWFSSRSIGSEGCPAKSFIHFSCRWMRGEDGLLTPIRRSKSFCITEGLLKGDVAQLTAHMDFICVPGADNLSRLPEVLAALKSMGVVKIYDMLDMDEAGAEASLHVQKVVEKSGLLYERKRWDPKYKGIDDLCVAVKRS